MNEKALGSIVGLIICIALLIRFSTPQTNKTTEVQEEKTQCSVAETIEQIVEEPKDFYREDIPLTYDEQKMLYELCELNLCPYDVALAVIYVETGYRNVIGDNGESFGYFQLQAKWLQKEMQWFGITDLMDTYSNFMLGTSILGCNITQYGLVDGLTKYNTGHLGESEYATKVLTVMEDQKNELISD